MASPHAAGAAALYLGGHPRATPAQVSTALVAGAVSGKVSGEGLGSPDKLLHVPRS
jgi:subtilisin family serine protease